VRDGDDLRLCAIGDREQPSREAVAPLVVAVADGRLRDLPHRHVQIPEQAVSHCRLLLHVLQKGGRVDPVRVAGHLDQQPERRQA
jgi:hypothetical protein